MIIDIDGETRLPTMNNKDQVQQSAARDRILKEVSARVSWKDVQTALDAVKGNEPTKQREKDIKDTWENKINDYFQALDNAGISDCHIQREYGYAALENDAEDNGDSHATRADARVIYAGEPADIYEWKVDASTTEDAMQVFKYWLSDAKTHGKSPHIGFLVAKSHPDSVQEFVYNVINRCTDQLGNPVHIECVTHEEANDVPSFHKKFHGKVVNTAA